MTHFPPSFAAASDTVSEIASETTHSIFYPLSIIAATSSCTNYSQINNVPHLFGVICVSFWPPRCSDRKGKGHLKSKPPANYISNYLS